MNDALPLKHLNKVSSILGITCNVSYVDNEGKQHSPE
jgi:hypothetical protein